MKYVLLVFAVLVLTSCATILNKEQQALHFYTDTNSESLKIKDVVYSLPTDVHITRSKENLTVNLLTDSLAVEYTILSEDDPVFLMGNIFIPFGYIVDLKSDKRFCYKSKVYLDPNNATRIIGSNNAVYVRKQRLERSFINKKGDAFLYLAYTPLNMMSFNLPEYQSARKSIGTWLGDIGAEYYYADDRYIKAGFGLNSTAHLVPMEYHSVLVSYTLYALNFHALKRFNVGYGVYTGRHFYREEKESLIQGDRNIILTGNQATAGVVVSANYIFSNTFSVGLNYKSSVYRLSSPSEFVGNHMLSIELIQRIRLKKK